MSRLWVKFGSDGLPAILNVKAIGHDIVNERLSPGRRKASRGKICHRWTPSMVKANSYYHVLEVKGCLSGYRWVFDDGADCCENARDLLSGHYCRPLVRALKNPMVSFRLQ
jgi:hypothetical protein